MNEEQMKKIAATIHLELDKMKADDGILDDFVHDIAGEIATSETHQHEEDMADAIIDRHSNIASNVNNTGWMGQVFWLLQQGVTEAEIRAKIS